MGPRKRRTASRRDRPMAVTPSMSVMMSSTWRSDLSAGVF